jgi:glucoamylase
MPLMWAHAEYIKLLRSVHDRQVFDRIPAVAKRYIGNSAQCKKLEIWKHNRKVRSVRKGYLLRIQASDSFLLRWSGDEWKTVNDRESCSTPLGIDFTDIPFTDSHTRILFTFYWENSQVWEGQDYEISVVEGQGSELRG